MTIDLNSADVQVLNDALVDAGFKRTERVDWRDNRLTDITWQRQVYITEGKGRKARQVHVGTDWVFLSLAGLRREDAGVAKTAAPFIAPVIDRLREQTRAMEALNGRW